MDLRLRRWVSGVCLALDPWPSKPYPAGLANTCQYIYLPNQAPPINLPLVSPADAKPRPPFTPQEVPRNQPIGPQNTRSESPL